jgi:hypothetical protein
MNNTQNKSHSYQHIKTLLKIMRKVIDIYQKGDREQLKKISPLLEYLSSGLEALNVWVNIQY